MMARNAGPKCGATRIGQDSLTRASRTLDAREVVNMKASTFPGARRAERKAIRVRGRRRSTLVTVSIGTWSATFRVVGVGVVNVPTVRAQARA